MPNYAIGALLITIIIISVVGNILVCIAIATDRRLRKVGNLFLVSLAVADLLVACVVMTVSLINDMMGYWMFGQTFCDIWIAFDVMCCTSSILNLCAISLDRFIHIKDPLRYSQRMTRKVVILSVAMIWFTSFIISFLPITLGWHKPDTQADSGRVSNVTVSPSAPPDDSRCIIDFTPTYAVFSSSISFYLPCIIMVALYTRLYLYAKKHVDNIKSMTKPLHMNSNFPSDHHSNQHVTDHKAAITVGVIMGVFLFSWVPFFCMNVIAGFCKTCIPEDVFITLTYIGWFNSGMNPVIYSIFNTEFREAFRKILFSYIKDRCCNRDEYEPRRHSSRSSDAICNKNGATLLNHKLLNTQPNLCKTSFISKNCKAKSSNSCYADIVPAKSTVDMVCHHSDGKINSI